MNFYRLMIPLFTLLTGIIIICGEEIFRDDNDSGNPWLTHTFVLILAFFQQVLLYRMPDVVYVRGGMVLDGTSQVFSLALLALAIIIQLSRTRAARAAASLHMLTLGLTLFALFTVQANRLLFGVMGVVGMLWTAQGAMAIEAGEEKQPGIIHSAIFRSFIMLFLGVLVCVLGFALFGETQLDEIQKTLIRSHLNEGALFSFEIVLLFLGALVMGLPPFQGILGRSRNEASWSLSLGATGLFAIVGVNIFIRWALVVFSRPAIGGLELEPLTHFNMALAVRIIVSVALILTPLLALLNSNIRGSFCLYVLNPLVQALFALSFAQKEVLGLAMSEVLVSALVVGILVSTTQNLKLEARSTFQDWIGLGRRDRTACLCTLLALAAGAGFAPFFGSVLLQKTLSINSFFVLVLLANVIMSAFYVARLTLLGFHRSTGPEVQIVIGRTQRFWFTAQVILLIFMGIFWQPLYKYGAFSIRGFFGEL